ncbi:hypothetical protein AMATHDRAFT_158607 [Amanita thiersii Skay4041]|uniref:Uncharacterized protein n=1 Tax=Amanita thiersii Skay4041 TaxID=703135 RepID=A0A2A9NBH0_9AGAR|nr:hypothetical protein AMATHDRAFT_158607 [Amanita thiersii Skay4041]
MSQVSTNFRSLYRLFLRSVSASVLHHPQATRNLRRLWRPIFESGSRVMRELDNFPAGSKEYEQRQQWLKLWNQRLDNTLAFLYNSSQSRGLSHKVTRNLAYLVLSEQQRIRAHLLNSWNPQKPMALAEASRVKKKEKNREYREFIGKAWTGLSQVVKLAEAKDGITVGRIVVKGWKANFMRNRGL